MPNILITGANRGLGLEYTRQYAEEGWRVFATCRRPTEADALQALADEHRAVSIHRLDVTCAESVKAIGWELENEPIDILLNNAGIYLEKYEGPALGAIRYDDWLHTLETNTLGAVRVTEGLIDHLERGERRLVVVMSSHMGSIADIEAPGSYYYRSSKAALNAAMQGLAVALRPKGIGVLLVHPGGVKTRMGPRDGIDAEQSVRGLREIIAGFTPEDSGRFIKYDGSEMPW
jgi:NAD(P)-dependent dehydrogenase (short-subunit alcohol dehydrogenase family)